MATRTTNQIAERLGRLAATVPAGGWYSRAETLLHRAVPFDAAGWQPIDPVTLLMTGHWSGQLPNPDPARFAGIAHNEYVQSDVNRFVDLAATALPVATLKQATHGRPTRSQRYRELLRPNGFGPELRAALIDRGSCWGSLILIREHSRADFTPTEVDIVARAAPVLARLMRREVLTATVPVARSAAPPGVVLLDPDGVPRARTATVVPWLDLLPGAPPPVLTALASAAHAHGSASVTTRAPEGTWLSLNAALLDTQVSVVIGLAVPAALHSRLLAAFDLSPREQQVVGLVLAGRSTVQISRELFITPYTVKDHLKTIFDKTGVRSRRELPARLFHQHHPDLPR